MRSTRLAVQAVAVLLAFAATARGEEGPLLERVAAAYREAGGMRMEARVVGTYDVAGRELDESSAYTAVWAGDGIFRYEIEGELLVAGDGSHTYVFLPAVHRYFRGDWPADGVALNPMLAAVLADHNMGLRLAMAQDPAAALAAMGRVRAVWDDPEGRPALRLERTGQPTLTLVFDPETHLLLEAIADERAVLEEAGVPDVMTASKRTIYDRVETGVDVEAAEGAWQPPPSARRVEAGEATATLGGEAMMVGVGQPAPALDLPLLAGGRFLLAQQHGKVVVLDFWATWCGPCVQAMPHLDALAKARAAEGVQVVAVNLRESQREVTAFMEAQGLAAGGLTVAMDVEGEAASRYGVRGIPHQVVIGRDGVVREVIVGLNPARLDAAVAAALAE